MTVEEMEAHAAYEFAFHKKLHDEMIAEATAELEKEKDPFEREWWIKHIEAIRAIGNGRYD
jgi:hypothetical protein